MGKMIYYNVGWLPPSNMLALIHSQRMRTASLCVRLIDACRVPSRGGLGRPGESHGRT